MRKLSALGVGYLVDELTVVCAAHGEGGRAAAVGEGYNLFINWNKVFSGLQK